MSDNGGRNFMDEVRRMLGIENTLEKGKHTTSRMTSWRRWLTCSDAETQELIRVLATHVKESVAILHVGNGDQQVPMHKTEGTTH